MEIDFFVKCPSLEPLPLESIYIKAGEGNLCMCVVAYVCRKILKLYEQEIRKFSRGFLMNFYKEHLNIFNIIIYHWIIGNKPPHFSIFDSNY